MWKWKNQKCYKYSIRILLSNFWDSLAIRDKEIAAQGIVWCVSRARAYLSWFDKSRQKASLNKRDSLVIHAAPSCSWICEINDPRVRHRQHRRVGDLRGLSYGGPCCVHGATPMIFCTVLLVDTSDARRSNVRDSSFPLSSLLAKEREGKQEWNFTEWTVWMQSCSFKILRPTGISRRKRNSFRFVE